MLERPAHHLDPAARPWLGANFWSANGGPAMWPGYDRESVRPELEVMARHGLNVVRAFAFWPDFMPEPGRLDATCLANLRDFCELAHECGLQVIPTFLVGHMSGQNWDPPWRHGRDLYSDAWMLGQQAFYISSIVSALDGCPSVTGWLISNEMPLYGGNSTADTVQAWARICVHAVRAGGSTRPVSLGDGAWGRDTTGRDNGYRLTELIGLIDFVGPHVYPADDDQIRLLLKASWVCELSQVGLPVVLEEFGVSSSFGSDENVGHYYRLVLATSLMAGATGWIAWNNTDFALTTQAPYSFRGYELGFGLTDTNGIAKASLREMAQFAKTLELLGSDWARAESNVAVLVSSHLDSSYPMTVDEDSEPVALTAFQSWIACRTADLAPAVVRERELVGTDGALGSAALWLVPCAKELLASTAEELRHLAQDGATVYLSYFAGVDEHQRGVWWSLADLAGVSHQLFGGLVDPIDDEILQWTMVADFGDLAVGDTLRFPVAGTPSVRARLPLAVVDAEILAVDDHGHPALVRRRVGAGQVVLAAAPIEAFAGYRARANPDDTVRLYGALAVAAGCQPAVGVPDDRIIVDQVVSADGRRFVLACNLSATGIVGELVLPDDVRAIDTDGGEPLLGKVTFGPFGVRLLELVASDVSHASHAPEDGDPC